MESITTKLEQFFSEYPQRYYKKGDTLVFADNSVPPVFFLAKGRVGQYDIAETGNKVTLNIFNTSAFFPMSNAINQTPNTHFYEALDEVQVHVAPAEAVVEFLQNNPDVQFDLLARLYRGVDGLLGKLTQLMSGTAYARLLLELTVAARRFGEVQADGSYLVQFTEMQLAQQTGLARETVSRELQKMKQSGVVAHTKQGIKVQLDVQAL